MYKMSIGYCDVKKDTWALTFEFPSGHSAKPPENTAQYYSFIIIHLVQMSLMGT